MADSYPSVGLRVDLNEIVAAKAAYSALKSEIKGVGEAADQSVSRVDNLSKTEQQQLRLRLNLTKQMISEEASLYDGAVRTRIALAKQQTAEAAAGARAETAAMRAAAREQEALQAQTLALRLRLTRQMFSEMAAEEKRQAAEQVARAQATQREISAAIQRATALNGVGRVNLVESLGLNAAVGAIGAIGKALGTLEHIVTSVRIAFFNLNFIIASFVAGIVIAPILHAADAMTALEARTRFYAKTASDVPYTFEAIYQTAQATRTPLEAVATLYTRLAPLAERLGKSQLDILRTVRTVSESFQIGGATPEEARSSSQQLAQALASNRLGGDELRSLAENAPILVAKIAASLNMNVGQFIKWAHAGNANAAIVIKAIDDAAADIDRMFKAFPVTIGQATATVGNAFTHLVGEVNKATGASTAIATFISNFAGFLDKTSTINAVAGAVNGLGTAFGFLGTAANALAQVLPVLATALAVVAARMAITAAVTALGGSFQFVSTMALTASGRFLLMNNAMNAMSAASAGALSRLGNLVNFFGGPLGVAVIAAAGAFFYFKNALDQAKASSGQLAQGQEGAIGALQRATAFAEAYGQKTDYLTTALNQVSAATAGAATEAREGAAANDAAAASALARAQAERALTIAMLSRQAADAVKAGDSARKSALASYGGGGVVSLADRLTFGLTNFQGSFDSAGDTAMRSAKGQYDLATLLFNVEKQLKEQPLTVTKPGGGGPPSLDTGNGKTGHGFDGAINQIAKMKAEIEGLKKEVATVSADPLAVLSARIIKAGEEAAAARTAGKGNLFQDEAQILAMMREELKIRLELLQASAQNTRQSQLETTQASLEARGHMEAQAALQAYYKTGQESYQGLQAALDAGTDATLRAKIAQDEFAIAQRYGVDSVDKIAAAYGRVKGVTAEAAAQVQQAAKDELAAAVARDTSAASTEKATRKTDDYTAALQRQHDMQVQLQNLVDSSGLTPAEREVQSNAEVYKATLLRDVTADRVGLTDQEALAQGRILALIDKRIEDEAKLKIAIQDSIRTAFIESGKLDFSSLKDGVLKALRQAIYDAFLAKPIQILVDAVVNWETQAINSLIGNVLGGSGGGAGQLAQTILGPNGQALSTAAGEIGGAAKTFSKGASMLTSIFQTVGVGAVFGAIGGAVGGGITGLLGGDKKQSGVGSAVGVGAGATLGLLVGGPIGALIGGALGGLVGLLSGKESNHAAIATLAANGALAGISGDKRTPETTQAVTQVASAVQGYIATLAQYGVNASNVIKSIDLGTRDATHINLVKGGYIDTPKGDAQALSDAIQKALLQNAKYTDAHTKAFVDQMIASNKSLDEITTALQAFVDAQKTVSDLQLALLKFTNPEQYAVQSLQAQQLDRRRAIQANIQAGYYTQAQITQIAQLLPQLERKEIEQALANVASSAGDAAHSLQDFADAQKKILDYVQGLSVGALSPLSPQAQLALQQSTFATQAAAARGGNYTALTGITGTAQTYLEQAQKYYGSGAAYASIFSDVSATLNELATMTPESSDAQVQAINDAAAALQAAIEAGSLSIVQAIATSNDNTSNGTGNGGAALTQAQVDQIVAGLATNAEVISGITAEELASLRATIAANLISGQALSGGVAA